MKYLIILLLLVVVAGCPPPKKPKDGEPQEAPIESAVWEDFKATVLPHWKFFVGYIGFVWGCMCVYVGHIAKQGALRNNKGGVCESATQILILAFITSPVTWPLIAFVHQMITNDLEYKHLRDEKERIEQEYEEYRNSVEV